MKQKILKFVVVSFLLSAMFGLTAVNAQGVLDPYPEPATDTTPATTPTAAPASGTETTEKPSSIESTFDVGRYLNADGQNRRVTAETVKNKNNPLIQAIIDIINTLVALIGSLALLVFVIGALLLMSSEGKEDRLEKGKSAMIMSLIGLAIAITSFVMVAFVQSIFF